MFLVEVGFRSTFAFLAAFLFLKSRGRRGIRQLALFELVVILTLGSADSRRYQLGISMVTSAGAR
jgi:uncharacterized membrane protein YcaP (DUF421 family)